MTKPVLKRVQTVDLHALRSRGFTCASCDAITFRTGIELVVSSNEVNPDTGIEEKLSFCDEICRDRWRRASENPLKLFQLSEEEKKTSPMIPRKVRTHLYPGVSVELSNLAEERKLSKEEAPKNEQSEIVDPNGRLKRSNSRLSMLSPRKPLKKSFPTLKRKGNNSHERLQRPEPVLKVFTHRRTNSG